MVLAALCSQNEVSRIESRRQRPLRLHRRGCPSMGCIYICIYTAEYNNNNIFHLINIKSSKLRKDVEK